MGFLKTDRRNDGAPLECEDDNETSWLSIRVDVEQLREWLVGGDFLGPESERIGVQSSQLILLMFRSIRINSSDPFSRFG
jgi:hypothetical protein